MRTLRLLLALLALPLVTAQAQEAEPPEGTRISSAHVSGLDLDKLSPGLQADIGKLADTPLNRQQLRELAGRIEAEQPRYIAAIRLTQDPDGAARVVFVLARVPDPGREQNVNERYLVEEVEIRGVRESDIDPTLLGELHALKGKPLDSDEAERLQERLKDSLRDYEISRRTTRGSQPGRIKLVFHAQRGEWSRWLRFEATDANAIYHSDQGWGSSLPIQMGDRAFAVTALIAWDIGDDLIEEYSGFGLRFETRKLGTERLGALVEWSTYDQTWREATLFALPGYPRVPPPYRNRMSVTPLVKFAVTRQVTVSGGVGITELDELTGLPIGQMANVGIGSVSFTQRSRKQDSPRHDVEAAFVVRAGTEALESDLVYERYLGQAGYAYRRAKHTVVVSAMAGRIDGDAPLFERFSLGDSRTLRGWNKYDIAPAGGDRMFHTSLEYRFYGLGMFLDAGSVWNRGTERRVRFSSGVTYSVDPFFMTVGFPLNTNEFGAVFTMGLQWPVPLASIKKF